LNAKSKENEPKERKTLTLRGKHVGGKAPKPPCCEVLVFYNKGCTPAPAFVSFDAKETKQKKTLPSLQLLYFYPAYDFRFKGP